MPTKDTTWQCPTCGHQETQPAPVAPVWHRCPHRGERLVELVADCAYCTHAHADHMHDNPRRLCRRCMCIGYTQEPA